MGIGCRSFIIGDEGKLILLARQTSMRTSHQRAVVQLQSVSYPVTNGTETVTPSPAKEFDLGQPASRSEANRAAASFLPMVLRAAMAGKFLARGRALPSSQL